VRESFAMRQTLPNKQVPDHFGLAYEVWAPFGAEDGKIPDSQRAEWLGQIADIAIPADYARSYARWKASFSAASDRTFELKLVSRLLIGHGNTSATDVGLTVHRTWGVPVIPGSALKGLLAHYVSAVFGPSDPHCWPWEQTGDEQTRAEYQGVLWQGKRIKRGPGAVYRALFGAPDADEDDLFRKHGFDAGAVAGLVTFHDALYVPRNAQDDKPFALDVLTVHQKPYYDDSGQHWPNDYSSPNPVSFLTVRPGTHFLFALSGPADWTELAESLLVDALQEWGVGGKTSAGYGRLLRPGNQPAQTTTGGPPTPRYRKHDKVTVTRVEDPSGKGKIKFKTDDDLLGQFAGEPPPDIPIGETIEVWIANVNQGNYTFTRKPPTDKPKGKSK
jgi:CRISPR-associated protein Cmr6